MDINKYKPCPCGFLRPEVVMLNNPNFMSVKCPHCGGYITEEIDKDEYSVSELENIIIEQELYKKFFPDDLNGRVSLAILDYVLEGAKKERREIKSYITRIYHHMLKYITQPSKQSGSWINSIRNSSAELYDALDDDDALKQKITEDVLQKTYNTAIERASGETGIDKRKFPKDMYKEWTLNKIININFIEEFLRKNAYTEEAKKYLYMI